MSSAFPPMADIPGAAPLKAHGVVRKAITLAYQRKIRTPKNFQRKLLRSPFSFQNCTKPTKYEALEKKYRLQAQNAVASAISSTVLRLEGLSLLGILGMID